MMTYLSFVGMLVSFFTSTAYSDEFSKINPPLNTHMQSNEYNATLCINPAEAEDRFDASFRYGCFCGKNYPNIQHPSQKPYYLLDYSQRDELIAQYYSIKPYDDIDEACMQHDICYIYQGRATEACNDAFYHKLQTLATHFNSRQKESPQARECQALALDIASVFRTVFGVGDDASKIRWGMFAMTTPFTIANKAMQKSSRKFSDGAGYPKKGAKCLVRD